MSYLRSSSRRPPKRRRGASSPHARRGVLWDAFKRQYGAAGDPLCLVAHGASRHSIHPCHGASSIATLDDLERDEALNIGAELGEVYPLGRTHEQACP
jgi:hypothetical protein